MRSRIYNLLYGILAGLVFFAYGFIFGSHYAQRGADRWYAEHPITINQPWNNAWETAPKDVADGVWNMTCLYVSSERKLIRPNYEARDCWNGDEPK